MRRNLAKGLTTGAANDVVLTSFLLLAASCRSPSLSANVLSTSTMLSADIDHVLANEYFPLFILLHLSFDARYVSKYRICLC